MWAGAAAAGPAVFLGLGESDGGSSSSRIFSLAKPVDRLGDAEFRLRSGQFEYAGFQLNTIGQPI
jgi:hypothetical protein